MPTVVLHHLEASRSHRVLWLLEELGVDYEMKVYARNPKTLRAPKEARAIHPLGKFPMVEIDGEVFAESGPILEELLDRFDDGALRPPEGTPERRRYRYWLHYAEGSLMPPLLVKLIVGQLRRAPVPFFLKPVLKGIAGKVDGAYTDPELRLQQGWIEQSLSEHPNFVGDRLTGADIQMSYPLEALLSRAAGDMPHATAWMARMRARPAYQRALDRGGEPIPG